MRTVEDIMFICNPVLHKYTCGDRKFEYYEASVIARPYPIKETTGEHDCHTCEGCQNNRNQIVESLKVREGKFPLCCEYHKRLLSFKSFDATQYKGAANLCADKVIFTYQHILNNQNNDSWQIDIKQYLNYAIDSFGCFPEGYGEPLFLSDYIKYVTALINGNTDIKQEVRKYVHSYFEQLRKPRVKGDPIKLLLGTYNRWLNLFPFNISFFRDLRCDYANRTPLIITGKESNIYSTEVSFNLITPDELIEFLRSITSRLFEVVSSKIAVGIASNYRKFCLELIQNEMIFESHLLNDVSGLSYIDIIRKWFSVQKIFVSQLRILDETNSNSVPDKYPNDSYKESLARVRQFRIYVEDKGLSRLFKDDQSERRMQDMLQLFFNNTDYCVDREVNNGRGPTDFKVSKGASDCTIIETKLAKSTKLRQNLKNQVEIYCNANDSKKSITLIGYFCKEEQQRAESILKELDLFKKENYILVNCEYNLPSASNVK